MIANDRLKLIEFGMSIDSMIELLSELGFSYLDKSDLYRRHSLFKNLSSRHYPCYSVKSTFINSIHLDVIHAWNPEGKIYCEFEFCSGELSDKTKITIGKNTFIGSKAIRLAKTNLIADT